MSDGSLPPDRRDTSARGRRESRRVLLDIAPTCAREVAVVACDGCRCERMTVAVATRVVEELRPHIACHVSMPEVLFRESSPARRRYIDAHATLALAGCEHLCPRVVLTRALTPDVVIGLDSDAGLEETSRDVAREIDRLAGYPALSPETPWSMPLAARSSARRFEPERVTDVKPVGSSRPIAPSEPPEGAPRPRTNYFDAPPRPRRWRIAVTLVLLAVCAGVTYLYWPAIRNGIGSARGALMGAVGTSPTQAAAMDPGATSASPPEPTPLAADAAPVVRPVPVPIDASIDGGDVMMVLDGGGDAAADGAVFEDNVNVGWIGGSCDTVDACDFTDAVCLHDGPLGLCTRQCDDWCPLAQTHDHTGSRCVDASDIRQFIANLPDLPSDRGRGFCLALCDLDAYPGTGCRPGMVCTELPLRPRSARLSRVCVPGNAASPGDAPESPVQEER